MLQAPMPTAGAVDRRSACSPQHTNRTTWRQHQPAACRQCSIEQPQHSCSSKQPLLCRPCSHLNARSAPHGGSCGHGRCRRCFSALTCLSEQHLCEAIPTVDVLLQALRRFQRMGRITQRQPRPGNSCRPSLHALSCLSADWTLTVVRACRACSHFSAWGVPHGGNRGQGTAAGAAGQAARAQRPSGAQLQAHLPHPGNVSLTVHAPD